ELGVERRSRAGELLDHVADRGQPGALDVLAADGVYRHLAFELGAADAGAGDLHRVQGAGFLAGSLLGRGGQGNGGRGDREQQRQPDGAGKPAGFWRHGSPLLKMVCRRSPPPWADLRCNPTVLCKTTTDRKSVV